MPCHGETRTEFITTRPLNMKEGELESVMRSTSVAQRHALVGWRLHNPISCNERLEARPIDSVVWLTGHI